MSKFNKVILIVLGIIIIVALALPAFIDPVIHAQAKIEIKAPTNVVFNQIDDYRKWTKWSAWEDSSVVNTYSEEKNGIPTNLKWSSEENGRGGLTLKELKKNQLISSTLNFEELDADLTLYIKLKEQKSQKTTEVEMAVDGTLPYFFRWMKFFMNPSLERDFKANLNQIKTISEQELSILWNKMEIETIKMDAQPYIYFHDTTTQFDDFSEQLKQEFSVLSKEVKNRTYQPIKIYNEVPNEQYFFHTSAMIIDDIKLSNKYIKKGELLGGKYIKAKHLGKYEDLANSHQLIRWWMNEQSIDLSTPNYYEVFVSDPSLDTNKDNWITEIYYWVE